MIVGFEIIMAGKIGTLTTFEAKGESGDYEVVLGLTMRPGRQTT